VRVTAKYFHKKLEAKDLIGDRVIMPEALNQVKHFKVLGTMLEQDELHFDGNYEYVNQTVLNWVEKEEEDVDEDKDQEDEKLKEFNEAKKEYEYAQSKTIASKKRLEKM
jgi:hypothetical protein